jgi:hypothetical protein
MGDTETNRATAMIVPTRDGGELVISADRMAKTSDKRGIDEEHKANGLFTTECFSGKRYHCAATIHLPNPLNGGAHNNGGAFLRIAHVYANNQPMDFQILLYNGDTPVSFDGVQAVVDSTGRTSDMLRRIETRIELLDVNYPYPEYSVELSGGGGFALCKAYKVTKNNWITNDEGMVIGKNNLTDC